MPQFNAFSSRFLARRFFYLTHVIARRSRGIFIRHCEGFARGNLTSLRAPFPYAGIKNNTRERGSACHPERSVAVAFLSVIARALPVAILPSFTCPPPGPHPDAGIKNNTRIVWVWL